MSMVWKTCFVYPFTVDGYLDGFSLLGYDMWCCRKHSCTSFCADKGFPFSWHQHFYHHCLCHQHVYHHPLHPHLYLATSSTTRASTTTTLTFHYLCHLPSWLAPSPLLLLPCNHLQPLQHHCHHQHCLHPHLLHHPHQHHSYGAASPTSHADECIPMALVGCWIISLGTQSS